MSSISSHRPSSTSINPSFTFKFTSPGGKTHRLVTKSTDYGELMNSVRQKIVGEHLQFLSLASSDSTQHHQRHDDDTSDWLTLSYMDDENDLVLMSSDSDVDDAIRMAQMAKQNRVKLVVHDTAAPLGTSNSTMAQMDNTINTRGTEHLEIMTDDDDDEQTNITEYDDSRKRMIGKQQQQKRNDRSGGATPERQDLILPAAITILGLVIIGVFTYSHIGRSRG
jgi:hypothetical protein